MRKRNNKAIKFYTRFFKALSDPIRLSMAMLLTRGELCVCQIETALGLHQAKISRHLAYLRKHKIVEARSQWKWKYYSLVQPKTMLTESVLACLKKWAKKEKQFKLNHRKAQKCLSGR